MSKKIVIDAGHGGTDSGAVNNGIIEKDYTLKISNYLKKRFDELGIESSMVRTGDEFLNQSSRPKRVQSFYGKGDDVIVLSNHINAGGGDGAEIIYALRNNDKLSKMISNELELAGQNVRKYYQKRLPSNPAVDYYYMLRDTKNNETVIIEYGFLDSTGDDVNQIKNNWEKLAEAVVKAVSSYIGVKYTTDISDSSNNINNNIYIVQKGDSLWSISKKYNTTVDEIKKLNNLNSNLIKINQQLIIPQKNIYVVKKGDTLYGIAKAYGTSVNKLKEINNLSTDILQIGQIIKLS